MISLINDGTAKSSLYLDLLKQQSNASFAGHKRSRDNMDLSIEAVNQGVLEVDSQLTESQNPNQGSYQIINMNVKLNKEQEEDLIRELAE